MGIRRIVTKTLLILTLITISTTTATAISCDCGDICVNETGWWHDGGAFTASTTPIQAAVDNASIGETIYVWNGSYIENVNVNTQLTLQGEGANLVNVTAASTSDHVFEITANYVNIAGFNVTGATGTDMVGIYLSERQYCNIKNNNVSGNYYGIYLSSSSNNNLTNNTVDLNNKQGIYLSTSSNNMLTNNTANSNSKNGIFLYPSCNFNTITNNTANLNAANGIYLSVSSNNALKNNTANSNDGYGILLLSSSNSNMVMNNTVSSNSYGIVLYNSNTNNIISSNIANSNTVCGISLGGPSTGGGLSSNNRIYNNYFHNIKNAKDDGTNSWNITPTTGTNIIGGSWLGGNYWSDCAGADSTGDGLGDNLIPHDSSGNIDNGGDYHPLVTPSSTPPVPTGLDNMTGNDWVIFTWIAGDGIVTDGYNVSMNDGWYNTTVTFLNSTVGAGNWSNIIVWAWNATGDGNMSVTNVNGNVQALASSPTYEFNIYVNETGWWNAGGGFNASNTAIQHAINNATAGNTIYVYNGSYNEDMIIDKSHLTLRGEGEDMVTVTNSTADSDIFEVTADYVNISGFNLTGAKGSLNAGINLYFVDFCEISNNTVNSNTYGIYMEGSNNNTLKDNIASENDDGVILISSNNNMFMNNTVNLNTYDGIYMESSNNNNLIDNTANTNDYGIYLSSSSVNMFTNNTVDSNTYDGIYMESSSNNNFTNNAMKSNSAFGIYLDASSNNMLTNNTVDSNNERGIVLYSSNDNTIYNNYFNNTINVYDDGNNIWNTTLTEGINIIGGSQIGGNYWSNYTGVDNNGDGLGDTQTPYNSSDNILNGGDHHPLVMLNDTPPSGLIYLHNITHAQTYINWTWTDPVDPEFSKVMIYLDGVFQENITSGVQCYNATLLTPGTTYEIGTMTVNTTGNINQTWVNHTATTASTMDITPPIISNVENTDPTTDSATIFWDTDENSCSVVMYGAMPDNYTNEESDSALVTSHNISLTGLSENTTYYYVVNSTDASGNAGEDGEYSFTTAVISGNATIRIGDIIAMPNGYAFTSIMVDNVNNLGSGTITVTYNSSVVHVTNVTSGDGNALVIQDWNADNTAGSVTIAAWDAAESHDGDVVFANIAFHAVGEYPDSTPLDISSSELTDYTIYDSIGHSINNGTFSTIDNQLPVITGAIATQDIILNDNGRLRAPGTNVTVLNATVIDSGSGVMNVTIDLSPIGGLDDQVMERIAGTDVWTIATTATDGINLTHELVVTASDRANNTNTSVIGLTVLLRGDVVRDGNLNSADVLYIAKYIVGKESMPSLLVGDISPDIGDGRVTSADALYLAKYLVGKEAAP
ncbi:MAG: NosD domain-containing protein [Methanosarcinaceae archaeon]